MKLTKAELELIRGAVNVGPEDQSLWYYHQFLLLNLTSRDPNTSMVPHLSTPDRVAYIQTEIAEIKDLLEDYVDIKWIYEALMGCTLAVAEVEGRELSGWLGMLRELDHMR